MPPPLVNQTDSRDKVNHGFAMRYKVLNHDETSQAVMPFEQAWQKHLPQGFNFREYCVKALKSHRHCISRDMGEHPGYYVATSLSYVAVLYFLSLYPFYWTMLDLYCDSQHEQHSCVEAHNCYDVMKAMTGWTILGSVLVTVVGKKLPCYMTMCKEWCHNTLEHIHEAYEAWNEQMEETKLQAIEGVSELIEPSGPINFMN